ncbi:uncharacterized protein PHACADRAFT_257266 [Phanerochaete carnosa HHB-10118-sp]|uniref:Uncharacterized protein n=1 Tax=Phanerochaete carnosa (strain HHB-10118-sp) TaxID=650164 RepID=K5VX80_PHACS|nr:uncharacterized protein PHACADRAFT_257266 [Phanerochaete carnosa HHB-10118-sp]EKM56183.1 hypothetical protein PHACADRAFT_257266 [Phanerochaete carnosa HHB-10118-sp]
MSLVFGGVCHLPCKLAELNTSGSQGGMLNTSISQHIPLFATDIQQYLPVAAVF